MKTEQVDQALKQKFIADGERLVFWHDPNTEFKNYIQVGLSADLAAVQVLDLADIGGLSAKLRLEQDDPKAKYLIYSQGEMPATEEDWLFDIRLYSAQFHADMASIWLQELGLSQLALREHLKARAKFMGSQERRQKLAKLINSTDDEATLDLKMMAVLVGSPLASAFAVLRALCDGHSDNAFDLTEPPAVMATFEKMGLSTRFWGMMQNEFGYQAESATIAGLLRQLFVSEMYHQTGGAQMESLSQHLLPQAGRRNAVVFLTQWRDSSAAANSYDIAANSVANEQKVKEPLGSYTLETIKDVYTFWETERLILSELKDRVISEQHAVDLTSVAGIIADRKAGHWLSGPGRDAPDRKAIASAYDAVLAAAQLFTLHAEHKQALSFESPSDLFAAYQQDLHHFDRLYRRFYTQARPAAAQGWDLLKTLAEQVERVYDQGFLQPLGIAWSQLIDRVDFLGTWSLPEMPAQHEFYERNIRPHLAASERRRAFVIISDAFRYEAAQELTESLKGLYRMDAQLSAMLGMLPSYTALGMASLLPHKKLAYDEKGNIRVDEKGVASTHDRSKQLATEKGMACQWTELRGMKNVEARAFTEGKRVVYIYHNVIDVTGENASTEDETFEAVSDCIHELETIVQFCMNKLNAGKVWITADHGFVFQQDALDETDKSKLSHKPPGALKTKKRYVIGRNLGTAAEAHHGSIDVTAQAEGGMEFWIPRAANRFHFVGGARFIHGGAMPQEVVVPLITVTQLRGEEKLSSKSEKVGVRVLGTNHKITTPIYRFELIQTEAVSERRKPITLRAAIYEGDQAVTSVETVTFESTSDSIEARKKSMRFELRTGTYDKNNPYRLVLRDMDNDAEVLSLPVVIDRSFDDDF